MLLNLRLAASKLTALFRLGDSSAPSLTKTKTRTFPTRKRATRAMTTRTRRAQLRRRRSGKRRLRSTATLRPRRRRARRRPTQRPRSRGGRDRASKSSTSKRRNRSRLSRWRRGRDGLSGAVRHSAAGQVICGAFRISTRGGRLVSPMYLYSYRLFPSCLLAQNPSLARIVA